MRQCTFLGYERVLPLFPMHDAIMLSNEEFEWYQDFFRDKKKLQEELK
jgi:hypothetical protein